METEELNKVIIVEGLTDKEQVEKVIEDQVTIICTNGTLGIERFDELLYNYQLDDREVFILVDEDRAGISLRNQLRAELPHAHHIHVSEEYREVAATPENVLAALLVDKHIKVNTFYLGLNGKF